MQTVYTPATRSVAPPVSDHVLSRALRLQVKAAWCRRVHAQLEARWHSHLGNDIIAASFRAQFHAANRELWGLLEIWGVARRQVRGIVGGSNGLAVSA